jgi:hypothetical protein
MDAHQIMELTPPMRRLTSSLLIAGVTGLIMWSAPQHAHAAEFTDLLDAADDFDDFDEDTWDPFDFNLEPTFIFQRTQGQVTREAPCVPEFAGNESDAIRNNPRLVVDRGRCNQARMVNNRELLFERNRAQLDLDLRAGIYKDLELRFKVPYVFSDTRRLTYDQSDPLRRVDGTNSSVAPRRTCPDGSPGRCIEAEANSVFSPSDTPEQQLQKLDRFNGYHFFETDTTYTRSGWAEPTLGLAWSIFNDERDDTKANLLLSFDYTMPIVQIAQRGNSAVGRGMHELKFAVATSKKFDWIEPYMGLNYTYAAAASDSPIREVDKQNIGQVFINPPMRGEFTVGTEFIPYEDAATGARYGIDLRFTFGYTSEGRDYTPMFDHFVNSGCNGKTLSDVLPQYDGNRLTNADDVACAWIVRESGNARPVPVYDLNEAIARGDNSQFFTDGIMTVESYATFTGSLGLYLQPTKYFQFKLFGQLSHDQEHFITNGRTGRDMDDSLETTPDNTVDLEGPDARFERNPTYNPTFDRVGERFRVQAFNTWMVAITAALQF